MLVRNPDDPKLLRTCHDPIPLPSLKRFNLSLCLMDIQYLLRHLSTPKTAKIEIQVITSHTLIRRKDRRVMFPEDPRCICSFSVVRTLIVDVEKRSVKGWAVWWRADECREDSEDPLIYVTVVPVKGNESRKDSRATTANDVFAESVLFLFQRHLSPAALFHLVIRDIGRHPRDGQRSTALLKPDDILPSLRQFVILTHLRFQNCSSDFVDGIYREMRHSASPRWSLKTLIFSNMDLLTGPLRNLSQIITPPVYDISLTIPSCVLFASSQIDGLETAKILTNIKCLTHQSTVSVSWNHAIHLLEYDSGAENGGRWQERGL